MFSHCSNGFHLPSNTHTKAPMCKISCTHVHTVKSMILQQLLSSETISSFPPSRHLPTTYSTTIPLYLACPHHWGRTVLYVCVCVCVFHQSELIGCDRSQGESQTTAVNTDLSIAFSPPPTQHHHLSLSHRASLSLLHCLSLTSLCLSI